MSIEPNVHELVRLVEAGRIDDALHAFYDPDVAMQENQAEPVVGRDANLARERAFFGGITLHGNTAKSITVGRDRAVINWVLDFTGGDGVHYVIDQLATQQWKNGRIVHERFVYDSAATRAAG
ncbi:MAG: nuclear transport factor 2 family protein [Gemmatimonadaceae bacterium]|nr:nuclear transport factor 2 family protein [Gemmatimonadaceae bacterium]